MSSTTHSYLYDLMRKLGLSDFGARTTEFFVARPLHIALIILIAWVASRVGSRAMERFIRTVHRRAPLRLSSPRSEQRTETMAGVLGRLVRLIAAIVAGLLILGSFGIDLAPLLAGASIAGVALGFGAQSLVRDMLAGLFIIGEDQYGVGDIVDLGTVSGVVEDVNLRSTRVRSVDGTVWFVPNGQLQRVGNTSMEFSRAVVDIPLLFNTDLERVQALVDEEVTAVCTRPEWRDRVLEAPAVLGVQQLDVTGPIFRVVVKTVPAAQAPVARELRLRVVDRLQREGLRPAS